MTAKILLVSSFEPWSLGLSYLRAFRRLGHEPICFDMTKEYEKVSRLTKNRYTNRIILPYAAWVMNKKLLKMVKDCKPDLVFIHKGQLIYTETLKEIKANTRAPLFIFNPDDPFNLNRGASSNFIRNSIPLYDCYFIWSKILTSKLKNAGAQRVEYLPFACDPELHYPVPLTERDRKNYASDVVFVGTWDEEREKWLSGLEEHNLAIWGSDYWGKRCKNKFLRYCWKGRILIGEEMAKACLASKINVNVLRLQNKGSHNMRTFEIPACGGFMLHERSDEVLEFFEEGKEIECFSSVEELRDKINFYLKNDNLRIKIAKAGYEKCMRSGYLYGDRVKQVLEVYEKLKSLL
ncbi:MAG: Spore protein YkvP [candidate division WS2 bacterium]|nr:Spore protein YkvP [Candidatus Lithacetigena glycinireducens]